MATPTLQAARVGAPGSRENEAPGPHDVEYGYAWRRDGPRATEAMALETSRAHLDPARSNPTFLGLVRRRQLLEAWLADLPPAPRVLDIGGRLQPWRPLLGGREAAYVAVDPIPEGLCNVVAMGSALPFPDASFELVLSTQTLGYAGSPEDFCHEAHRVLVPSGAFVLSAPAILPAFHDCRWCFTGEGLEFLLADFETVEVVPETNSLQGLCHTLNLFLDSFVRADRVRRVLARTVHPALNLLGQALDGSTSHTEFSTGYCCRATKAAVVRVPLASTETAADAPAGTAV